MNKNASYYWNSHLKPPRDFWQFCRDQFDVIVFKRKDNFIKTTTRSEKKHRVTYKQLRSNTNTNNLYFRVIVCINLAVKDRYEDQEWEAIRTIDKVTLKEKISIVLLNLSVYENDEIRNIKRILAYQFDINSKTYIAKEFAVSFGRSPISGLGWDTRIAHYPQKPNKNDSPFWMMELNPWEDGYSKSIDFVYIHRKSIAFCERKGMLKLKNDILYNIKVSFARLTRKRVKIYWPYIAKFDLNYTDFINLMDLLNAGYKIAQIDIKAISCIGTTKWINEKHNGVSRIRIINYLCKQKEGLNYYYDYLDTLTNINATAKTEIEFFPKILTIAHDRAVGSLNAMNRKIDEENLKKVTEFLLKLEYKGKEFCVIAPKSFQDIVDEGKKLQHCVGGKQYLEGHRDKEFAIMFCRLNSKPDQPLVTFTYEYDKSITEIHSKRNQDNQNSYYKDVCDFLRNEWLPYVRLLAKKNKRLKNSSVARVTA